MLKMPILTALVLCGLLYLYTYQRPDDLLELLNRNSGGIAGIAAVATVFYAHLTNKLVAETAMMRKAATDPCVLAFLRPRKNNQGLIDLVIKNIGAGPAFDVSFSFDQDIQRTAERKLSDVRVFTQGLSHMVPNYEFEIFLANLWDDDPEKFDRRTNLTVTYKSVAGATFKQICRIDVGEFEGITVINDDPLIKLAKSVEAIKVVLEHQSKS